MRLRTRLMIALGAMILGPVILAGLLLFLIGTVQGRFIERTFGVEFSINYLLNASQAVSESNRAVGWRRSFPICCW